MALLQILGITHHVHITEEGMVEITVNAMVSRLYFLTSSLTCSPQPSPLVHVHRSAKVQRNRFLPPIREVSEHSSDSYRRASSASASAPLAASSRSDYWLEGPSGHGSVSPGTSTRPRNESQFSVASTLTASSAVVPVPVVNSAALGRRRAESSDSNSTLPGELLLYSGATYISGPCVNKSVHPRLLY
jgi:hypothetical protein